VALQYNNYVINFPSHFQNIQSLIIFYLHTQLYYATLSSNAKVLYQFSKPNHEELTDFNHVSKRLERLTID